MIKVTVAPRQLVVDRPAELVVRLTNVGTGPCTNLVFRLALPIQILVLRDGRIVEHGAHGTLLAARGHYYELARRFAA